MILPIFLLTGVFLGFFTGCTGSESGERPVVIRIAEQHGLAYLPLAIMQVERLLERELAVSDSASDGPADVASRTSIASTEPRTVARVEWVRTGNATMIREAMLSNRLDIGFMGIPPFLIGRDRETGWRLITGLAEAPLGLVTLDPAYRSLNDLGPRDRLALPQPGSIQHILLAMAAEREFGDARRFDDQLVSMGHPEGLSALLAGRDVKAHFTAPPYIFEALESPEASLLLDGRDAFEGRYTFIIGVVASHWDGNPRNAALTATFLRALDRAIYLAETLQDRARTDSGDHGATDSPAPDGGLLRRLAEFYNLDARTLERHLSHPGIVYTREVHGVERFIERMDRYDYIREERIGTYHSGGEE